MEQSQKRTIPVLLTVLTIGLPVVLILSAVRTYRQLDEQKAVFLRSRVAALAGRLETLPESLPQSEWKDVLSEEEEALAGLDLYERQSSPPELTNLWEGRELFRIERRTMDGQAIFRAYVPFHSYKGMQLARIDIDERAAEFLVAHARHHLILVAIGGLTILILSGLTARYAQRAAIAERRQLELQHLAHIGEMSAVLAHEIRNPLGTIKGFAQLLGEKLNGEHAALLSPIFTESSRLERLVKDLLLYGRPAQPVMRPADSSEISAFLQAHAGQLALPDKIRFEMDVSPATFETDLNLLEQVLLNLLRNGVDAVRGREEGVVRFEMRAEGGGILMRVSDNGAGFSEQAHARLFEPFFTSKASGTGLGLCISRKLVEALGGTLTAFNLPYGGAAVEIRLPAFAGAQATANREIAAKE